MTKHEYSRYQAAVADFFAREGLANLSAIADDDGNVESYFSNRPCECCGCHLAGDREDCNGYNPTTAEVCGPFSVCPDCVYFAEYGRLDDDTMWSIERAEG